MPQILAALLSGLVFGLGLVVSQMVNPAKVLNFLDVAGAWDPSLAFVMAGAIPVAAAGFALAKRRRGPVLAQTFQWSQRNVIDRPLLAGAAVFGVGWGLVGFCPGPAVAALGLGPGEALLFLGAMVCGMASVEVIGRIRAGRLSAEYAD